MIKVLEKIVFVGILFLAIVIGAGMATLVIEAIEQTKATACFEYKSPEACEDVIR